MSNVNGKVSGFTGSQPAAQVSTAFDQQRLPVTQYIELPDAANATFVPIPNAVYRSAMGAGRNFTLTTATCAALKLQPSTGTTAPGECCVFRIIETTANVITFVTGGAGQVATGTGTLATVNGQTSTFVLANQGGTLTLSRMGSVAS